MRTCWLHVHVPKAGGSTVRQLMNRNFAKGYYNSNSLLETKQYNRQDVYEIIRIQPWLKCLSDHKLSFDIPLYHDLANVMAYAFVRDPVDRFVSRYFYHRNNAEELCLAKDLTFHDFAQQELVEKHVHPQTNNQVYFLNGGQSESDLSVILTAIRTQKAFLFPVERFDEAVICLERKFPDFFRDLSYVRANESQKSQSLQQSELDHVREFFGPDYELLDHAHNNLDVCIESVFKQKSDLESALEEFKHRCQQRETNFKPMFIDWPGSSHKDNADSKDAEHRGGNNSEKSNDQTATADN